MKKIPVKIKIQNQENEFIPKYATADSAGADLKANIKGCVDLKPGQIILVPTGIFLEIPKGFEIQIRPRSGLALNYGITVLNSPGTIDSDYRGEIKVILINHSRKVFKVEPKMRIGQMILAPIYQIEFIIAEKLAFSKRGEDGFGHSGAY